MTDGYGEFIAWIRATDPLPDGAGVFDGVVREVFFTEALPLQRPRRPAIVQTLDLADVQMRAQRLPRDRQGRWRTNDAS